MEHPGNLPPIKSSAIRARHGLTLTRTWTNQVSKPWSVNYRRRVRRMREAPSSGETRWETGHAGPDLALTEFEPVCGPSVAEKVSPLLQKVF